jgi:hypothetical protein
MESERLPLTRANGCGKFANAVDPAPYCVSRPDSRTLGATGRDQISRMEREKIAVKRHQIEGAHLHIANEVT